MRRRIFAPWANFVAAVALFVQLLVLPAHHPETRPDLAAVAASLKATFGDAAVLCAQSDDATPSSPARQHASCNIACPLCQFAAQTALIDAPPPTLPERLALAGALLPPPADFAPARPNANRIAQPRGPPAEA